MNAQLQGPTERDRVARAKSQQDYDNDPPRCITCVYFRREPHTLYADRKIVTRRGKEKTVKVRKRAHPISNPIVDRCSFGNFEVKAHHVCNEWHSHSGERVADEPTTRDGDGGQDE